MQMVVSANGHHKVPFVDLVIAGKVGWKVGLPQLKEAIKQAICTASCTSKCCVAFQKSIIAVLGSAMTHPAGLLAALHLRNV